MTACTLANMSRAALERIGLYPGTVILWEGPSALDGAPIVVLASGLDDPSANVKTGPMIQCWILRQDVSPADAVKLGLDVAICGLCPHRGSASAIAIAAASEGGAFPEDRTCYVNVARLTDLWDAYKRGRYARVNAWEAKALFEHVRREVRIGAYGDPAAAPYALWSVACAEAEKRGDLTGYTHQWRTCDQRFANLCMASCDSAAEAEEAEAMGWRTFRVLATGEVIRRGKEAACPAANKAAKRKVQCVDCKACGGHASPNKASIAVPVHGPGVAKFNRRAAA